MAEFSGALYCIAFLFWSGFSLDRRRSCFFIGCFLCEFLGGFGFPRHGIASPGHKKIRFLRTQGCARMEKIPCPDAVTSSPFRKYPESAFAHYPRSLISLFRSNPPPMPKSSPRRFLSLAGGLASASFYIPYRGVKRWSWETYWLVGGFLAGSSRRWRWLPCSSRTSGRDSVRADARFALGLLLWRDVGVGGLTFGLTMRYLGIALGMAVALGFCAAFGTLVPPIFSRPDSTKSSTRSPGKPSCWGSSLSRSALGLAAWPACRRKANSPPKKKLRRSRSSTLARGCSLPPSPAS